MGASSAAGNGIVVEADNFRQTPQMGSHSQFVQAKLFASRT